MMIDKQGKIYIDPILSADKSKIWANVVYPHKYDRNEEHGAVLEQMGLCKFWAILFEFFFKGYKITISKETKLMFGKDFKRGIMFDPPEKDIQPIHEVTNAEA